MVNSQDASRPSPFIPKEALDGKQSLHENYEKNIVKNLFITNRLRKFATSFMFG